VKTLTWLSLALIMTGCTGSSWTNSEYLYRYVFWGPRNLVSPSTNYGLYPSHAIAASSEPSQFAPGPAGLVPETVEYQKGGAVKSSSLDELLASTGTHAFIVIKDNQVIYEKYFNGYQRDSVCMSRSLAKSFTSALVGIAIGEGHIRSVNDPITNYLPELKERGFERITLRNLLTMGSGIKFHLRDLPWDEQTIAYMHPELRDVLLHRLEIAEPPGQSFNYDDYNTLLLGIILERTTNRTPSEYLEEKIWQPVGMEFPATWSIDSERDGLELMHVALNARAIDFAKFGQLYLQGGSWNGRQIIPAAWIAESTTRDPEDTRKWETYDWWLPIGGYYKYFWWGIQRGGDDYDYEAIGKWGQSIYVSPRRNVVIVRTADGWGLEPYEWPAVYRYIADHAAARGDLPGPGSGAR
jgi:CubicO group peptidase (beta-lactamase class C family)